MSDQGAAAPTRTAVAAAVRSALDRSVTAVDPLDGGMNAVYRVAVGGSSDVAVKVGTAQEGAALLSGPLLAERLARETSVPVPEILAAVPADESPLDAAYVVMEFVDGRRVTDVRDLSPTTHERLLREAGDHLAAVHGLDYEGPYGRLVAEGDAFAVEYPFDAWAPAYRSIVEWNLERFEDRFDDLRAPVRRGLDAFEDSVDEDVVDQSILYRDYHAKNLVFERADADRAVRAVLDFNYRPVGDAPVDVAVAETTLVDTPLGDTDRADRRRATLRDAYVDARDGVHEEYFDDRYPAYRLLSVLDHLHYFEYFVQFVPGDDDDAAEWLREFVRARVAELVGEE